MPKGERTDSLKTSISACIPRLGGFAWSSYAMKSATGELSYFTRPRLYCLVGKDADFEGDS